MCFSIVHRDLFERASPSAVRGPVLVPPCMRHRPFRIAGDLHRPPARVFAPHRAAVVGSPGGLPFLSQPLGPTPFLPSILLFIRALRKVGFCPARPPLSQRWPGLPCKCGRARRPFSVLPF